ncbi:cell division protein [Candidatus Photodesmus katoptron]|uniref:Probable peptidoglycan glycosyltransferase FtsW n=1 Tax=Candidatus Photodesmus katoptron Akat1 TaxID=1236703 RepID=S3EHR2_9GAMM|nr:cell division protein FtsW [Candidatus Photodesmus katoptron]EPE37723.1 cell cycle protein [Candidatus Photodesmus katoptron Akat1]KEY90555.1 cell division protein [Candidatus Photodesmus katoptron]
MDLLKNFFPLLKKQIFFSKKFIGFDRQLLWTSLCLMLVGLIMVTSASFPISIRLAGQPFYFMFRHAIFCILALFISSIILKIPLEYWMKCSPLLLAISFFLLGLVLVFGKPVNGSSRWLSFGMFNFQPAELAKLTLFIFMSGYLVRKQKEVRSTFFGGFLKPVMVFSSLAILLLYQPDLGSIIVMLVTLFGMLFIAGAKLLHFIAFIALGIMSIILLIFLEPYRIQRVISFLDPWEDPFGSGYQLTQSLMAFGRGSWFGQGLGNSIQKLEYLPEAHTDFVFAVLAEELGFIGVILVLFLILNLVLKALFIGKKSFENNQYFSGYLAFSFSIWFTLQTLINVGAVTGIVPTKGLTLPLVSYGGSSLIIISIAISMLLRIDYEYRLTIKNYEEQ